LLIVVFSFIKIKMIKKKGWDVKFLLSTDTLNWFGLDLIFQTAKDAWFDWLDLAIWKNFDTWNIRYVRKLVDKYDFPIKVIQTSPKLNKKEIDKALDLCEALNVDTLCINAPKFFDYKTYYFIRDNIELYKSKNKDIKFSIINPSNSYFPPFSVIPKYRFNNIVEIIKKYWCNLWLDIAWMDLDLFESDFLRRVDRFVPYVSNLYLNDASSKTTHLFPWEWEMKIPELLRRFKREWYSRFISLKVNISKVDLADPDKVDLLLRKAVNYYNDYYVNAKVD